MLEELADESENQGLKMNKSKTNVIIENQYNYVNNTQMVYGAETWELTIQWKEPLK